MIQALDPRDDMIYVEGGIGGALGLVRANMIVDTGATTTVVASRTLRWLGYRLADAPKAVVQTGGGPVEARRVILKSFEALGLRLTDFPVLASHFDPADSIDGAVGLDFLRRGKLVLDFPGGEMEFVA